MKRGLEASCPSPTGQVYKAVLAMGAVLVAAHAGAQSPAAAAPAAAGPANPPMAAAAPAPVFAIRGFQVEGDNPLAQGQTARVLAPFLRSDATMETLQQATAALEAAFRERGYGLHRVALPPQELGETVRLSVVRFTLGKIDFEGRSLYDEANIRRSLPQLREGATPNFKRLAIETAIANENPNKQVQVGLRESEEADKIDVTVAVKESRPWTFTAGLSNAGSDASGRDRLTIAGGHTNVFNLDHQFNGAYTTSVESTDQVRQLGLNYRIPLYGWGGVAGVSYTNSDVVGNFGAFTSTGAGHTFGLSYMHYLPPEGGRRSFVTLGLDDKVFDAARINGIVVPGTVDRRSRPFTVGYNARNESDESVWGYSAELAVNTGSGRGNDLAAYRSEDPRLTTTRWKALRGGLSYAAPLGESWTWSARAQYQVSPDVLISGEQFGLGGMGSVRGTAVDRPVSGDKGVSGSVEFASPELAPGLRAIAFADAGWLGNNEPNGVNKPSSDRLASVGLGLRYLAGIWTVTADYGRLVLGSRVPLTVNAAAPQRGDDKLYVNVGVRF